MVLKAMLKILLLSSLMVNFAYAQPPREPCQFQVEALELILDHFAADHDKIIVDVGFVMPGEKEHTNYDYSEDGLRCLEQYRGVVEERGHSLFNAHHFYDCIRKGRKAKHPRCLATEGAVMIRISTSSPFPSMEGVTWQRHVTTISADAVAKYLFVTAHWRGPEIEADTGELWRNGSND